MGDHHDIDNFEDAPDMQDVDENTSEGTNKFYISKTTSIGSKHN